MQDLISYYREYGDEIREVLRPVLRILVILVIAWAAQIVAGRLIRLFRLYMARRTDPSEIGRVETLARVFRNAAAVIVVLVAGMLILGELGISIAPILATAGVAGIAIGFGAQNLVKNFFSGFFLLLDDQIRTGDVVQVAGMGGFVEEVTLRYVRLRDMDGHVHYVPNGEIAAVTNRTRDFATPLIEVGVAYREDPDECFAVMDEVAKKMRADAAWQERIVSDLEVIGVDKWADSAVILRARMKVVPPIQQWNVKREFLKRLKKAFDARGIEIPFPHLTVYAGQAKDGSAPPFHLLEKTPSKAA